VTRAVAVDEIEQGIRQFLEGRVKASVPAGQDLFATGLVSSIFAMELIVHIEQSFSVEIVGEDLKLDNFRTIDRMTALVLRLRDAGRD
jgi:methoxymalonate biosynthesis acyl carrier protein